MTSQTLKQEDLHVPDGSWPKSLETEAVESYQDWRDRFAAERLRVLYLLGLIANPVFIAADILLYRDYLPSLITIRAVLELALLASFIILLRRVALFKPTVLLILWVLIGNLCIVWMTVVLGGFTAQYYNGLNLVFLAAAVIVPISWPSHLFAQLITLACYYAANFPRALTPEQMNAAIGNSFFLTWTCVATLFSVYLYERLQRAEFQARLSERHARTELEASNRKLLELDRLKSEFFANISHELRTPLTLSLGAFKTLLKLSPSSESELSIQSGIRNTSRLLFLINELLDLAKFDSGRAELRKQCIDLSALVKSVAANFQSSPMDRIHIKGFSHPIAAEVDPNQMKKVLYNLLSNAFKFSDPEKAQIWIRGRISDDAVELEVEDNGIGIPRDQLERIFDRFTQVEGSATRRYEGSGIGLALVKEIIALHGGHVRVESELGQGSTFFMTLPRGRVTLADMVDAMEDEAVVIPPFSDGQEEQPAAAAHAPDSTGQLPLVLVAEDNADMRRYLESVLGQHNRVVLAKDGVDALEQARALRPDLILTDAMMPRMSGYDLLKAIRADQAHRSVPVIFLTARVGEEARVESLEAGADDYISKPFNESELLARVRNMIRARAQERELAELQKEKLARFLPTHLADMITSGDRDDFLKGHRAEVTVLYIDLRGFTAFAGTAAPEDLMAILRQYQAEMGKLITDYNGTLEQYAGDSLMVFFNDPIPMPNHAEQAVRLAIAMRDRANQLQEQWSRQGFNLGAGIGMAVGYATLGIVGFERRTGYTAIGPVTNLACRLSSEAKHGQILVAGRLLQLVESLVEAQSVGDLVLKGIQQPVSAYSIIGLKDRH
jgi:signal transduction histidine kinase/class 3 adenylate cyclase